MPSSNASALDRLLAEAAQQVLFYSSARRVMTGPEGILFPMRGKRVLVTGATGMIGRIIVATLKGFGGIKVLEADSSWHIGEALKANADYVIHGAGYAQPAKFMAEPLDTIDLNTNWTLKLSNALRKDGRMIFLSTSEVCNGNVRQLHTEDDIGTTSPAHIRAAYIESKRCGEAIVHAARAAGKNITAARVSLSYGPGVKRGDTRVINEFITQALKVGQIVLQDGGQARRTYCYVTDTVEMILNILMRGDRPVYNVGGEGEVTVLTLARRIAAQVPGTDVKAPRGLGVAFTGAPAHVTLDMSRTKQAFRKFDFVRLDDGLTRTIAWHRALEGMDQEEKVQCGN